MLSLTHSPTTQFVLNILKYWIHLYLVYTGNYFRNLIKSNWNHIVFTMFRLIWNTQTGCIEYLPMMQFNALAGSIKILLEELFSKSYQMKPKSDCIYHAPIDLEPNEKCQFGFKSIRKWWIQSDFGLICKISLCAPSKRQTSRDRRSWSDTDVAFANLVKQHFFPVIFPIIFPLFFPNYNVIWDEFTSVEILSERFTFTYDE